MNEIIAANIRRHRDRLAWTQRHLADASKLTERTVQRAEEGRGLGAESLQAIAGAFNLSIDQLRRDVDSEKVKAADDKFRIVPLDILEHSSQLQRLLGLANAIHFDCTVEDDAIQEEAASLRQELLGCLDVWSDIDELGRRGAAKDLFKHVDSLGSHGLVVTVGLDHMRLPLGGGNAFSMTTVHVLVVPRREPKLFVLIDKKADIKLGR